jgi:multiple sugar transport system permease protein
MNIRRLRRSLPAYIFILPCTLVLLLMMVTPVMRTFLYGFSEIILPQFETRFLGFDNFTRIFSRPEVPGVLRNTAIWIAGTVVLRFTLGFGAALVLNTEMRGQQVYRVLALLPWTVPSIVAANTWRWIFQSDYGLLNGFLNYVGLGNLSHAWLGDPLTALPAVLAAYTWAGYPFVMIMLLAGMQGIPKELYDAARIDGCRSAQTFRYVTLPGLKPIIFVILLLEIVSGFNSFDLLFTMTGGGPGGASEILGLFIYRLAFTNFDFAGSSAVSVVLISMAIVVFLFYGPASAKRRIQNGGVKG